MFTSPNEASTPGYKRNPDLLYFSNGVAFSPERKAESDRITIGQLLDTMSNTDPLELCSG